MRMQERKTNPFKYMFKYLRGEVLAGLVKVSKR